MRLLRTLLAGLLGALALVVVTAAPSSACSCVQADTEEHVDSAEVVLIGTVTDRQDPPLRPVMSSGDPVTYTVDVERLYKGTAPPTAYVLAAASGASCGLDGVEEGDRFVFFAGRSDGELWTGLCAGTREADPAFVAEVEAAAGPASPPDPDAEPTARPAHGGSLATPVAAVSGLALVLLAGALWLRLLLRH